MRILIGLLLCMLLTSAQGQQSTSIWSEFQEARMDQSGGRNIVPEAYRTIRADIDQLKGKLATSNQESDTSPSASSNLIRIPKPEGGFDMFRIVEYAMMEQGLADRFPEIRTYRGVNISDPFVTIRMQWTVHGFGAMISGTENGRYFVVPFAKRNQQDYISYYKSDFRAPDEPFICGVESVKEKRQEENQNRVSGDCVFRTYRLAVATTGEYANFHDATSAADVDTLLSAVVIAVNRVNEVYERDVAVRMILIEATTDVFFYDGTSDPYTNGNGGAMLGENQTTCDAEIGSGNYDIGHVFSTGGGGVASLNAPCNNTRKARGVTGQSSPIDDPFYIDYVAHEMGHQFGANHTQNNSCNRNGSTAMEPGSASTIMGYAGICSPNVQSNSDDYFHGISIQEINNYISTSTGNNCDVPIPWSNNAPTITPGLDHTIPISTPFMLTVDVNDPDGDPIRYFWEQWDNEVGSMPPSSTNTQGPMFRSLDPTNSPTRVFPKMEDIVMNSSTDWEVLPSVSRAMDFRITAIDFHNAMAGCSDEDNVIITTDASAGPFVVLSPNDTSVNWTGGAFVDVTWDVANTNVAPVNCSAVDIFLSTDGGYTYPEILASGVSNNGTANIEVPIGVTTEARVMVKGADNVFFDISDANFDILEALPNFSLIAFPQELELCEVNATTTSQFDIQADAILGFDEPISLSISGLPSGVQGEFSPSIVNPGSTAKLELSYTPPISTGSFIVTVTGSSATYTNQVNIVLSIVDTNATTVLVAPANNTMDVSLNPVLSWEPEETSSSYFVEIATDSSFTNIIDASSTIDTFFLPSIELETSETYIWRVRSESSCHVGPWSSLFSFSTVSIACIEIASTDVPKSISSSGQPTVLSLLTIPNNGIITSLDIQNLNVSHTYVGDLLIRLISPEGTEVILMDRICGSQNDVDINLIDDAINDIPCPPNDGGTYKPDGFLASYIGENVQGTWTLKIEDQANADGGNLNSWSLSICMAISNCNKVVSNVNANGLGSLKQVFECAQSGDTITFDPSLSMSTFDIDSTIIISQNITVIAPGNGQLSVNGSMLTRTFEIVAGAQVKFVNFKIGSGSGPIGGAILNNGNLTLEDIVVYKINGAPIESMIENKGVLNLLGNCLIMD